MSRVRVLWAQKERSSCLPKRDRWDIGGPHFPAVTSPMSRLARPAEPLYAAQIGGPTGANPPLGKRGTWSARYLAARVCHLAASPDPTPYTRRGRRGAAALAEGQSWDELPG